MQGVTFNRDPSKRPELGAAQGGIRYSHTLTGRTSPLNPYKGVLPGGAAGVGAGFQFDITLTDHLAW